jgi:hypothetical protein
VTDVAERLARKGGDGRADPARTMRLGLAYVGVWSSTKLAFLGSVCLNIVTVAVILLAVQLLGDSDVLATASGAYRDVTGTTNELSAILEWNTVLAFMAAVVLLNTVLLTVLGTVYALLFNLGVRVTGGALVGFRSR